MNYPLISEYIEAIKSAEDNFEELTNLRAVLGDDGQPVMTSGNFAVVFKMQDTGTEKFYALKCFTKEQEGRAEAYHQIADALKDVDSPYLVSLRYLDKELFVDTGQTADTEFPVLLMDWVDGKTLDKYLREILDDTYALEMLAYRFSQLAQWLIPQPFAHGDLKPDNILVREDGSLVLVDYDGMYVPSMKGQKARELGSPDFRHPMRTENDFDEHIDDFPIISILLSLKAISIKPQLLEKYGAADRLLLSERDFLDICTSKILKEIYPSSDSDLNVVLGLFSIVYERKYFYSLPINLLKLYRPIADEEIDLIVKDHAPYEIVKTWPFQEFAEGFDILLLSYEYYSISEDVENVCIFKKEGEKDFLVYNFSRFSLGQIYKYKQYFNIALMASGHYVLMSNIPQDIHIEYLSTEVHSTYFFNCWADDYGVKYSADKKYLLEGPIKETIKGSHIWKTGVLKNSYDIQEGTMVVCDNAFFYCQGLISIKCPKSLLAIGSGSFQNCLDLKDVYLNHGILEIGDKAFKSCKSLHSIYIPEGLKYIANDAFDDSGIKSIYTCNGDKKRIGAMLPRYSDIIEELPF